MTDKPDDMPDVIYAGRNYDGTAIWFFNPALGKEINVIQYTRAPQPTCNADLVEALEKARHYVEIWNCNGNSAVKIIAEIDAALAAAKRQSCNAKEGE